MVASIIEALSWTAMNLFSSNLCVASHSHTLEWPCLLHKTVCGSRWEKLPFPNHTPFYEMIATFSTFFHVFNFWVNFIDSLRFAPLLSVGSFSVIILTGLSSDVLRTYPAHRSQPFLRCVCNSWFIRFLQGPPSIPPMIVHSTFHSKTPLLNLWRFK